MTGKMKVEEVQLHNFTAWFEDKLFHALSYELSRVNAIQLELMGKVSALQNGCEELRKYVVDMNILPQNQKPVLKLFDQVDSILSQFMSNQQYTPVPSSSGDAGSADKTTITVASVQPLPDTDYLKNYLCRLRNKARTLEEQFSSSKVVKNMEPADSSRVLPAVTSTVLRPLLNIVAVIDELDAEYSRHMPLIEHLSDLKAVVHKPLGLLLGSLQTEQQQQVAAGASSQDAALREALQQAQQELDAARSCESVKAAARRRDEVEVLMRAYLSGLLDCCRYAIAFVEGNSGTLETPVPAAGAVAAFNVLLTDLRAAAVPVKGQLGLGSNVQVVQALGGGGERGRDFLRAVKVLQTRFVAIAEHAGRGAGGAGAEAVCTRQAVFASSKELAMFCALAVDVERLALVIDDLSVQSLELGETFATMARRVGRQ
jgi:hypothetical protein